jgi:tRNA (guanine-N7-)-methyltransferase
MSDTPVPQRPIRSFVLRQGRITQGQQRAFDDLWPRFGVELTVGIRLHPEVFFGNDHPLLLEIGFGNGESLASLALQNPHTNYLGIEVHRPGVGHLLMRAAELDLHNLKLIRHDAMEVLRHHLPEQSLQGIMLFFPDPWHKKKHHKRRIVQTEFVELCIQALRPGGILHLATDWQEYAAHMMQTLSSSPQLNNLAGDNHYAERPATRPVTKFERRGHRLGHGVWDLLFIRN